MIERWQESELRSALGVRRGVHLTGARQSGKSTLAEYVASGMRILNLDEAAFLKAAKDDPQSFVERPDGKPLMIDEIQKAPELLEAIKIKVDHDNTPGQYLITGSSNLRFVKAVKDSLAGRLGWVRLRTLALGELMGGNGDFLKRAFAREFPSVCPNLGKREVIHRAFCGGYPEPIDFPLRSRKAWYAEYLDDLLTKDIQSVTEIRKLDALRKVANWLLAYSSKFFEIKDLCAASGLGKETVDNYLSALKTIYIFDELKPWATRDYAKIGKRSKYFAADPGLVANLLGWTEEGVYYDQDSCGKLIETWVYHELSSLADRDLGYEVTQYRDSDKREIDFMVEDSTGSLLGIEVKAGTVSSDDFKHLRWFGANLAKGPFTGIVLYSGANTLRFGEGFYAVPLAALGI